MFIRVYTPTRRGGGHHTCQGIIVYHCYRRRGIHPWEPRSPCTSRDCYRSTPIKPPYHYRRRGIHPWEPQYPCTSRDCYHSTPIKPHNQGPQPSRLPATCGKATEPLLPPLVSCTHTWVPWYPCQSRDCCHLRHTSYAPYQGPLQSRRGTRRRATEHPLLPILGAHVAPP